MTRLGSDVVGDPIRPRPEAKVFIKWRFGKWHVFENGSRRREFFASEGAAMQFARDLDEQTRQLVG